MADAVRAARRRAAVVVPAGLAVLLAGCSAGMLTPSSYEVFGGSEGRVGDIAIRDAEFVFDGPVESDAVYLPGDSAALQVTIVNRGDTPDRLVSVSSPIATEGLVVGAAGLPGHHALTAGYTGPVASAALPDTTPILLRLTGLTTAIRAGLTYPVDFTFARAGRIRLELPLDSPDEPREACPLPPDGKAPKVLTAPLGGSPIPPTNPPPDCSSLPTSVPEVQVLDVEGPLTHPVWATEHDTLLGFIEEDGRRLVRVDPETGETLDSRRVEGAGENFGLIPVPDERLALPLTGSGRIVLLDTETLQEVDAVGGLPAPSWVAVEPESTSLFALAEDGSTVTGVDYETKEELFRREVRQGPEAVVEPGNHVDPSFWLVAPDGVTYFSGSERPEPESTLRVELSHELFSSDDAASKSAYLASEGSSRVTLLEGDSRGGLELSESNDLSETVEHVEAEPEEEYRVYAVTATTLISLKYDSLEVIEKTEYRSVLEQAGLGEAKIEDVTVGDDYLYLAVEGEPVVLKIRKEESLTE